jgi:hypothetical protein
MELIQNQTIESQLLSIDGKRFVDCTLINCILEYRGRSVDLTRTRMQGCRYVFFDNARSTVQFLQGVGLL